MIDHRVRNDITLLNPDTSEQESMKKTIEEKKRGRTGDFFAENNSSRYKEISYKHGSAPVSNKHSDNNESIFSNSMKLAAFRAGELKKRNKELVKKYGDPKHLPSAKYELELIKQLHNAALTIQNYWRDYILKKKTPLNTEERNEYMNSLGDHTSPQGVSPYNQGSASSRHGQDIPKLDLTQVTSKKELGGTNGHEGIFNQEPLIDLSTKRLQNLILTADLSSMLKVREEALNYKIKKEKKKIQKLLSSQKISPRTGNTKEMELEKWVNQERKNIDKTKKIFEENKKRTEEIVKETMGIDDLFSNYEITQETLKKVFAEKVTTPREGMSFRSGFNSSRRLYELSQINKQLNGNESEQEDKEELKKETSSKEIINQGIEEHKAKDGEESVTKNSLKEKIEMKIKSNQEVTFEKTKEDLVKEDNKKKENESIELLDALKKNELELDKSFDELDNIASELESSHGVIDREVVKVSSKTPNIHQDSDEIVPESLRQRNSPQKKDASKSLEIGRRYNEDKRIHPGDDEDEKSLDDEKSGTGSLIRIKSEHNLKENKEETKTPTEVDPTKEKSYNTQNYFTDNFDNVDYDKAMDKIRNNSDLDTVNQIKDQVEKEEQSILLANDEQSISYDDNDPFKIDQMAKSDFKNLFNPNQTSKPSSGAILVNDNKGDEEQKDDLADSSMSDHMDFTKTVDLKKEGFFKIANKLQETTPKEAKLQNLFDTTKDDSNDKVELEEMANDRHAKSLEELKEHESLQRETKPVSDINIERIGSPNKPKHSDVTEKPGVAQPRPLKDDREKIDDEEEIITGSQIIGNTIVNNLVKELGAKEEVKPNSMVEYFKQSSVTKNDSVTGDIKYVIDDICKNLISELDEELFPQRPLFLLTADLSGITLEQATTLLNDLTPEKERIIVEKIMERQKSSKRHKKSSKSSKGSGKLVLYEKKGIRTDLLAIENYVEGLYKHINQSKKKQFMKKAFTSMKRDPFEMLNQLQNSDIGSYEHFEVDYNALSVLQLDDYLEMENYIKEQEKEEEKVQELEGEQTKDTNDKAVKPRKKRKRFEFDETGLSEKQIQEKKKLFRECEHIHNKALFDCINEALIQFRPYGKDGEPAPWSRQQRQLQKAPKKKKVDLKKMFETVRHDLFKWSITQAGTLPRKDFIFGGTFDEELFAEIREKKLANLLANEVIETEPKWLGYDFEEAQVRIDLGDMILEQLVSESIAIMNVVENTEHKKSIYTDPELVEQLVINEPYYNDNLYYYDDYNEDYFNDY